MQQEDDLRGLARVMDFMRAISILFVGINVYWFCYSSLKGWGVTFEVIDKILWNFQRTTELFSSMLWTKLFAVVFLALSCIGTRGGEEREDNLDENTLLPCGGLRPVFPELVAAGTTLAAYSGHGILHRHAVCGLYMPAHGGYMDVPPVEEQPYG